MNNTYSIQLPDSPEVRWRVRVIPANFNLNGFNWERPGLWGLPEFMPPGNHVTFSGTSFAILEKREFLPFVPKMRVGKSTYTLAWKDRALIPDKHIKQRIGAFLHAKGLPTQSLKGNGQLLACLRIIHATNLGFNLEDYFETIISPHLSST